MKPGWTPPTPFCTLGWLIGFCLIGVGSLEAAGPHDAFLGGPWEILIRVGLDGDVLHFPLAVSDVNRPEELKQVLPVRGTPVTVKFKQYLSDLGWETRCVPSIEGGCVAKVRVKGQELSRDVWLDSRDPDKRSISSEVGGIEIRELLNRSTSIAVMRALADPEAVGVLAVGDPGTTAPQEYVIRPGSRISLERPPASLSVLRYVPHYTVDKTTKEVVSQTPEPVNPAVQVRVELDGRTYERWVWARFSDSPHLKKEFPLHLEFSNYRQGVAEGKYLLILAKDMEPRLLFHRERDLVLETVQTGRAYPFANPAFTFSVEKALCGAQIRTVWINRSDRLIRPALVATVQSRLVEKEVVLEFNTPYHYKTESGTLVLVYRQRAKISDRVP